MDLNAYIEVKPLIGFPIEELIDIYKETAKPKSGIDLKKLSQYVEPLMVMEVINKDDSALLHYNIKFRECTLDDVKLFNEMNITSDFDKKY